MEHPHDPGTGEIRTLSRPPSSCLSLSHIFPQKLPVQSALCAWGSVPQPSKPCSPVLAPSCLLLWAYLVSSADLQAQGLACGFQPGVWPLLRRGPKAEGSQSPESNLAAHFPSHLASPLSRKLLLGEALRLSQRTEIGGHGRGSFRSSFLWGPSDTDWRTGVVNFLSSFGDLSGAWLLGGCRGPLP